MPPGENLASDRQERGADRAIDALRGPDNVIPFPGEHQRKIESLTKGIRDLEKQNFRSIEMDSIKQRIERGEITSFAEVMTAENVVKNAAIQRAEQELKDTMDDDEDSALKSTKDWIGYMGTLDVAGIAGEFKKINDIRGQRIEHKKNVESLKAKSPRAFKIYIDKAKENKKRGYVTSNKDILKDVEKTYAKAIKAPEAVQGEFFAKVEADELKEDSFEATLKALEAEHKQMVAKYEKMLDQNEKIFGKKPVQEFKAWLAQRKNFAEIQWAQTVLERKYIPERQLAQQEFEEMPEAVTAPHKNKWENDLGYSERKDLLDSLHRLEHQANNPLAQEYMQRMTNSPEEIASKEWAKMMQEFLNNSYEDQETLLKAYPLQEGKERRELADRFKALPEDVRQARENRKFFTLDKQEKITLLAALEQDQEGADSTDAWQNMIQTESGEQAFKRALSLVTGRTRGQAIVLADVLGKKTYEDQMKTGVVDAADRQEKNVTERKGDQIGGKIGLVHELTDEELTINEQGQEQEFHTMDLDALNQGAMEETSMQAVRREIREDKTITNDEKDTYSMARFTRRGSEREIDLAKDTNQRENLEDMVKQMLIEALMVAVDSMGGRPQREIKWDDLSAEQSKAMLGHYQEMTKMQLGLDGLTTMRKSA